MKGLHLTVDGWRLDRGAKGYKLTKKALEGRLRALDHLKALHCRRVRDIEGDAMGGLERLVV